MCIYEILPIICILNCIVNISSHQEIINRQSLPTAMSQY